jgi:hypothetical protein
MMVRRSATADLRGANPESFAVECQQSAVALAIQTIRILFPDPIGLGCANDHVYLIHSCSDAF